MEFLSSLLLKLLEPLIVRLASLIVDQIKEMQKQQEIERIDQAQKDMNQAKTPDEREKAEKEMADALSHL